MKPLASDSLAVQRDEPTYFYNIYNINTEIVVIPTHRYVKTAVHTKAQHKWETFKSEH